MKINSAKSDPRWLFIVVNKLVAKIGELQSDIQGLHEIVEDLVSEMAEDVEHDLETNLNPNDEDGAI